MTFIFFSCKSESEVKFEQYTIAGQELYKQHCSNCHGQNGEGLRDLYPPIKGADYLDNKQNVICIIKNGNTKALTVNGKTYNQKMPKNKALYDLDIAKITTFIYANWKDEKSITEVEEIKKASCINFDR